MHLLQKRYHLKMRDTNDTFKLEETLQGVYSVPVFTADLGSATMVWHQSALWGLITILPRKGLSIS